MPEDEQPRVLDQVRETVRNLLLRLDDIQRELDERREDRKKWPELERGTDAAPVPHSIDRESAAPQ